jgi:ribose transport system substrate-binding protein
MRRVSSVGRVGILILLVLFASTVAFAGGQGEPAKKQLSFAYVMPFAQAWYAYLSDAFKFAAQQYGVKTEIAVSEYNQNKEIAAIEDFIVKKPDMIALGSVSGDSAQLAAQKCNAAGIPLVVENGSIAAGPGKIVSDLEFDWTGLGKMMADTTADNWPGAKVFFVCGVIGTGPVDQVIASFTSQCEKRGLKLVGIQTGEYQHEKAYNVTQDLIQSGKDFDVIWGGNDTMGQGVIQAVREAGLLGKKVILTTNGSPLCLASIDKGELDGALNYSPGFHGLLLFLAMNEYATAKKVPNLIYLPMKFITKKNLADAMPWEAANKAQFDRAVDYFKKSVKK